jgi:WD40 repeat protein
MQKLIKTIQEISDRALRYNQLLQNNEEATKKTLIEPFIEALGYNIHDPTEVFPEFGADIPNVRGDRVDYALFQSTRIPFALVESKAYGEKLDRPKHISQLFKYYNATGSRFGILTNGVDYKIYADFFRENIMDEKPFLEFNIINFSPSLIQELKKISKFTIIKQSHNTWQCLSTLTGHQTGINKISLNERRNLLASASIDGQIKLWDLDNFNLICTLREHKGIVFCVEFGRNNELISAGGTVPQLNKDFLFGEDTDIKTWDLIKRRVVFRQPGHSKPVSSMVVNPNKRILVSCGFSEVKIWNLITKKIIHNLSHDSANSLTISSDGKYLISGGYNGTIKVWLLETGELNFSFNVNSRIDTISISPNSRFIGVALSTPNCIKIFDFNNQILINEITSKNNINNLVFSPDSKAIAICSKGEINIWTVEQKKLLYSLLGHQGDVTSITFNSNDQTLITCGYDKTIKVWGIE